jgi:hypothetical protein
MFAIGLVLVVFTWFIDEYLERILHMHPACWQRKTNITIFLIGVGMVLGSITVLAWRFLP